MKNYIGMTINANCFFGIEAVGGKIIFDELGLVFKSHRFNIQTGELRIEYSQIKSIQKVNTLGIVPNGMLIITKDGNEYRFVINNRAKVIKFLVSVL